MGLLMFSAISKKFSEDLNLAGRQKMSLARVTS
jgi:hypothetical protein